MATATINAGDIVRLKSKQEFPNGVVLRVSDLQEVGGRKHRCVLSDGSATIRGIIASQFADLVASGELSNGCVVKINVFSMNAVGNEDVMLATDLSIVTPGNGSQPMDTDTALTAHNATPEAAGKPAAGKTPGDVTGAKENSTPMLSPPTDFKSSKTPGPTTAAGRTPVSFTPTPLSLSTQKTAPTPPSMSVSDRKKHHKIPQLNPYRTDWCIKAKLERKAPLRSMSIRGADIKILTVDLVDDTGQMIQGTFWRAAAERCADQLAEGKVYVFHNFKVKPADKKYSSVKADYQIDFTDGTEVSEAADQDTTSMTAAVEITPIEVLPRRVGARAPVDVMGVVLALGSLGTVKRKADSSELPRRDVTLGDMSCKSVVVTLWGDNAHALAQQLDGQEGKVVLQVTHARVTDFNGCSVSSLTKSVVSLNPEGPATTQLLAWYSTAGMAPDRFAPVGQDLPGTRGTSGGSGAVPSRERFLTLKDVSGVTAESLPDDKAVFQAVTACVAMVNSDSQMYYLANPENGRKVVDQGGGRFAEADGRVVERPEHRYVLSVKVADHTGESVLQLFNKEAEAVMGMKADELAALKDAGEGFAAALQSVQWRPWSVVVMSKAREYNGEKRVRHTAHKVDALDWVSEGQRLVTLIGKYGN
ncbi:hypothetical protein PLESTB_000601900 [Pleodorina starrii]|uniref:Replication protein A subunit n=1 Tax=Pleodorina starrii TaxID=330485 RepID=A0A9W6F0W5_9CHLO|nr:hypothetical protein PLESTM_002033100 [Pleodorina starrii]GLC52257.1 hypothetical protein PLESTB_000601900 [Pleodorina starrii]GLC67562.1 hypothetical protein PLESTF_000573800 [Pleodorina starrii]